MSKFPLGSLDDREEVLIYNCVSW